MGLRSANYLFSVDETTKGNFLQHIPLEFGEIITSATTKYYKRGNDFWIDLLLSSSNTGITLSIRIALCNPIEPIIKNLHAFFQLLFKQYSDGRLLDKDSKRQYISFKDQDWELIQQHYLDRYNNFVKMYGKLSAPISDDDFHHIFG